MKIELAEIPATDVRLHGPAVPKWFKPKCDGCSIPGKDSRIKWVKRLIESTLDPDLTEDACHIHDFEYFLLVLCYNKNLTAFHMGRRDADHNLRMNRWKVSRNKTWGMFYSFLFHVGIRLGGYPVMLRKNVDELPRPNTVEELELLGGYMKENGMLTSKAIVMLDIWRLEIKDV